MLEFLESQNVESLNVNQGYSKCSTLIVDENSIITPDDSIHGAAEKSGINSLKISTGHVVLPGYDYGFIGGASGMIDNKVLLTGDFSHHPDYRKIMKYIEEAGKEVIVLSKEAIIDLGSILITSEHLS